MKEVKGNYIDESDSQSKIENCRVVVLRTVDSFVT